MNFENDDVKMRKKLGEKILNIRIKKGLTQAKAADEIKLTKSTLSDYENGKVYPRYDQIKKIAEGYNVSYEYLLDENVQNFNRENVDIGKALKLSDKSIEFIKENNTDKNDRIIDIFLSNINKEFSENLLKFLKIQNVYKFYEREIETFEREYPLDKIMNLEEKLYENSYIDCTEEIKKLYISYYRHIYKLLKRIEKIDKISDINIFAIKGTEALIINKILETTATMRKIAKVDTNKIDKLEYEYMINLNSYDIVNRMKERKEMIEHEYILNEYRFIEKVKEYIRNI